MGTAPVGTEKGLARVAILLGAQHTVIANQQCLARIQHARRLGWRALVPSIHQVRPGTRAAFGGPVVLELDLSLQEL